LHGPHHSAQ